jgi:hypothetical protein
LVALGLLVASAAACTEASRNLTESVTLDASVRDARAPEPDAPAMPSDAGADAGDASGPRAMCGNKLCQCDDG